jgi:Asp/Glu/hydantoin racemase
VTAFATNGFPVYPTYPSGTNAAFSDAQALGTAFNIKNTTAYWNAATPNIVDSYFLSNAVPAYVEVELGVLEPQILERYRSIGVPAAQRAYLEQHVAQVHLFRQRVAVRNVDFSAYVYP